jgi:TolA-binding protein
MKTGNTERITMRVLMLFLGTMTCAVVAAAQTPATAPAPVPLPAPAPDAPVVTTPLAPLEAPAPLAPPVAIVSPDRAPVLVSPDRQKLLHALADMQLKMRDANARVRAVQEQLDGPLGAEARDAARRAAESAQAEADALRQQMSDLQAQQGTLFADWAREMKEGMRDGALDQQKAMIAALRDQARPVIVGPRDIHTPFMFTFSNAPYDRGLSALQQGRYDEAITAFDAIISRKGARTDGALYWKAFAESRLARADASLATLAALEKDYPRSRYLSDARVLEADVRKMAGQHVDVTTLDANDDIKLLAINGIADSAPDKAIPLLESVLNSTNSLAVKRRAIYVLALSDDARAHAILLRYAKGEGNPDLQAEAIRYLASRRDHATTPAELKQIYDATSDVGVRRSIIEGYRNAGDTASLTAIVSNPAESMDLRRLALANLTGFKGQDGWGLYQQLSGPSDAPLRQQIVAGLAAANDVEHLSQVAKTDADENVRHRAVRALGQQPADRTGAILTGLYGARPDTDWRRFVIAALADQDNADALITLARQESNLTLKRDLVRRLSSMAGKNEAAANYLMEVIK